jgi:chaperonin GroES
VLACGEGRMLKSGSRAPMQVKVGDRVIFSAYSVDEFKLGDRQLVLAREEDILAIIG